MKSVMCCAALASSLVLGACGGSSTGHDDQASSSRPDRTASGGGPTYFFCTISGGDVTYFSKAVETSGSGKDVAAQFLDYVEELDDPAYPLTGDETASCLTASTEHKLGQAQLDARKTADGAYRTIGSWTP